MAQAKYDRIGLGYAQARQTDPHIAARIEIALDRPISVVNVGAGAGSYEPRESDVLAVEPSELMIRQRPQDSAPVVMASAENLPLASKSMDAAMAMITVHHWTDIAAGLSEMVRVARRRVVVTTFDPESLRKLWIVRDYFPGIVGPVEERAESKQLAALLPISSVEIITVRKDCRDLFFAALWARPELFFDDEVVRPMFVWRRLSERDRDQGRNQLAADLESGLWDERNGHLRSYSEYDVGLRAVISSLQ